MSTDEVETPHEEGLPWKVVGKFATYREASAHKEATQKEDKSLQVKVHRQARRTRPYYAVKARIDPEIQKMVNEMEKKSKKKGRK